MNKKAFRLFFAVTAITGFLTSSALAELGLAQMLANPDQGAPAVERALLAAVSAAYTGGPAGVFDEAAVQAQLVAILNEAVATGNEQTIRYAILAVMIAGGTEHAELSRAAVNGSNLYSNYATLTANTIVEVEVFLQTAGQAGGGGGGGGGGGSGGGSGGIGGGDPLSDIWDGLHSSGQSLPATRV